MLEQNVILVSTGQVATHCSPPPPGAPPSEAVTVVAVAPSRFMPQHTGFAGSAQSDGAVQSVMSMPAPQLEAHAVALVDTVRQQ